MTLAANGGRVSWLAVGAVFACTAVLHLSLPLNHDAAWILEGAIRLSHGAKFGRDVVDANPPLAWWIACIPAFAARTGLGLAAAWTLFVLGLGFGSLLLVNAALKRSSLASRQRDWLLPLLSALLLIAPGYDFGQREHLMLMAALPYAAASTVSSEGCKLPLPLAIAIGLAAGIGFCLKPYFLFVPLCVEIWLGWRRRSLFAWLRPEFLLIPAFGALYLSAVFAFAPLYLSVEVPQSQAIYWAYNTSLANVLRSAAILLLPSATGWLALLIMERKAPTAFAQAAVSAAIGSLLSVIIQHKGFSYHYVPAVGLLGMSCLAECVARLETRRKLIPTIVAVLIAICAGLPSWRQVHDAQAPDGTFARVHALAGVFRHFAGNGGFVYAFVTSPRDIHPAIIASGVKWAAEACCIYHLPAAIRADERPASERAGIRAAAAREFNRIMDDLALRRPAVVVIDASAHKLAFANLRFDYLAWLSQDARFRRFWVNYTQRGRIGDFRIFVRRTP